MSTDDEARQVYQARREAEEAKYSELELSPECRTIYELFCI